MAMYMPVVNYPTHTAAHRTPHVLILIIILLMYNSFSLGDRSVSLRVEAVRA